MTRTRIRKREKKLSSEKPEEELPGKRLKKRIKKKLNSNKKAASLE